MDDRDIPSVPITTLSGLASLSDLLSELPISESSVITSLNKSLLFHPRVAEEANNLLAIKDDNLTRQLVLAIEQTNADHIDLKSQYAEQPTSGTNINELPQLLQSIHTLKPTVFKTGGQQLHIRQIFQPHSVTAAAQQQQQQQNSQQQPQQQYQSLVQPNQFYQSGINQPAACWNSSSTNAQQSTQQQQHQQQQQQQPQQTHIGQSQFQANFIQSLQTNLSQPQQQQHQQQSQPQPATNSLFQQQQYMPLPIVNDVIVKQELIVKQEVPVMPVAMPKTEIMEKQTPTYPQQQQQQQQYPVDHMQQQHHHQQQQQQQQQQTQQHQLPQQHSITKSVTNPQVVNLNASAEMLPVKTNQSNSSSLNPQHNVQLQHKQANNHAASAAAAAAVDKHPHGGVIRENSTPQQPKMVPRNNEYLEKQSKNSDVRGGPSPAQASDAPHESNQIHNFGLRQPTISTTTANDINNLAKTTTTTKSEFTRPNIQNSVAAAATGAVTATSSQSSVIQNSTTIVTAAATTTTTPDKTPKKILKVRIEQIKPEDFEIMSKNLNEFAKKSPELALKLGVIKPEDVPQNAENMFSKMKDDEKRGPKRRHNNVKEEDEIVKFSQPKLRRIEMKSMLQPKEDVYKTQTYQQFMKNMEHELRRLEETEQPNNIDDIDYYSDCIPTKLLTQLTNDVAKLKAKGVVDAIPKNKLTLLINFAMRNVDVARNFSAGPEMDDDIEDNIEKILDAAEACLLVSNIYATASDVKFLQEDNMDKIIKFVQFQMRETIFPTYDPVFSIKSVKKSDNRGSKKKSSSASGLNRSVQLLYSKLVELSKIFVTLFDNCSFVDTIVLAVSTLSVEPFFVDNIETLQFACLELVTTIFRKENYVKYRRSILNDILASVDRLPCSKKNLRPYKLSNNGGSIQIVTALVLQLIQCSSVLPQSLSDSGKNNRRKLVEPAAGDTTKGSGADKDIMILEKYDTAFSIGGNFLTTFLNKCKSRSGETDFRPLFENFIYDLLTTVNKPEWPASEMLLSLLGTLLVKYMSDKGIEQTIRVVSLEYLGIVAARLRKDTVESRCKVNTMDALIKCIKLEQEKEGDKDAVDSKIIVDPEEERTEFLQKILLDFLAVNAHEDNLIFDYARHFYLTQWYKDVIIRKKKVAEGEKGYASRKKSPKKRRKYKENSESSNEDDDSSDGSDDEGGSDTGAGGGKNKNKNKKANLPDQELNLEIFRILDERKKYFIRKIRPFSSGADSVQDIKTYIDYSNAHLIAQYLASKRPFSQSFDKYLQKIILVVREPSIAIRTKAMKCLAMIVEVDPSILKRKDMQMGVSQKLLDTSISVREAAVDLVGKYVLSSPELIDQYYEMLSKRILDTGVSVRKRVIKILRDICIDYPDFDKIPEICVKMIRRVNDEEGIQKLVTEVFMRMWFTPCADNDLTSIERKINQMSDVVSMAHDTGTQWLDGLLTGIFTPKEEKDVTERNPNAPKKEPPKEVLKACQQLADGLVNAIIVLEGTDNKKVLSCITTLNLLAKVRPILLVKHAMTLEPYLNIKGNIQHIVKFISFVAEILEQVVPLMEHPSESFLADLETHLMMLVCSHNQSVVHSCLSCLGAIVNRITKNYKLIRDCFTKCYRPIVASRNLIIADPNYPLENVFRPLFRRGLFTIGLIFRYFDFKQPYVYGEGLDADAAPLPSSICNDIFDHLIFLSKIPHNDIRRETLIALGHFCIKNYEYLTDHKLRDFYCDLLTSNDYGVEIKINVLRNINMYLHDADQSMAVKDKDWQTQSLVENLCDMGDVISGMSSRIIQLYLPQVLNSLLHYDFNVRLWSMKVVQAVLRQGLVHPNQIVPYLISLSTDNKKEIAHRADHHLQEIDKQYPGFVNMKCQLGIQLSYRLQRILQINDQNQIVRGFSVKEKDEQPTALNGFLYTLLRSTKPQRRALVQSITKQFEEHRATLDHMLYLADNLAYFPYIVQDEPLYIIHQIDLFISCTGTNILQTFKDNLIPLPTPPPPTTQEQENGEKKLSLDDEDDDEDLDSLYTRLPEDTTELQKCIISSQGCILLLVLKQHLKTSYRITEGKISRYSPSEAAKVYEKSMQRHPVTQFNPKSILNVILEQNTVGHQLNDTEKKEIIERYLDFKQLMLKIDKEEEDNDSDRPPIPPPQTPNKSVTNTPIKENATPTTTTTPITGDSPITTPHSHGHHPITNFGINRGPDEARNVNNIQMNTPVLPRKDAPANSHHYNATSNSTPNKSTTPKSVKSSSRKQPSRSKRKRRKIVSSSEESESDDDY